MFTADTNVFVDFFRGVQSRATNLLKNALDEKQIVMNPFVLAELLSSPKLSKKMEEHLLAIPRLELSDEFFERSGHLRRKIYEHGAGVSITDIYIAQACIDTNTPLLSRDQDLQTIANHSLLKIVK